MFSAGALPLLVGVLETHKSSAGACQQASAALGNIANGSEARKQAVFDRGMSQLVAVLVAHKTHEGVCVRVSIALYNIATVCPSTKAGIVSAGAVPALAAVWKAHSGKARSEAHDTLEKLGYNDDGSKK